MIKLISLLPCQIDIATFIRTIDKQIAIVTLIGNLLMAAEIFPFRTASEEAVFWGAQYSFRNTRIDGRDGAVILKTGIFLLLSHSLTLALPNALPRKIETPNSALVTALTGDR